MNRNVKILIGLGGVLLLVYMVYLTITPNRISCEVCMEFKGRMECRRASGKDMMEAQMTATSTACSLLSGGIDDGIACRNTMPASITCQNR